MFEAEYRRMLREEIDDALKALRPVEPLPRQSHVDYAGAAHMLGGISVKSVKRLVADGTLPTVDVGLERVLIPVSAIEELPTTTRRALRSAS